MPQPARFRERRLSLQVKLVVGLLVIVLGPLAVAAYLIDQIDDVAANFGAQESETRDHQLEQARQAYALQADAMLRLHDEIKRRLAALPAIAGLDPKAPLADLLRDEPDVVAIAVTGADGAPVAQVSRPVPDGWELDDNDQTSAPAALPGGGALRVSFIKPAGLKEQLAALGKIRQQQKLIQNARTALPRGYRLAFLALVGAASVIAVVLGILAAQRVTRRIGVLVAAARSVAGGDTAARAALRGRDEMAELAVAFNSMLDGLERQKQQIEYLQRIGAWQDVARKLAHEIKNPLTPIQLAVQQCVSSYQGDDARFARTLKDTGEIVEEEIAGLRRLVDTFRTLGQLPRVEAHPVPLREVIGELRLDPTFAERLAIAEPDGADAKVNVRADKLLLKRVIANLVENGIHAGREAGRTGDVAVTWTIAADRSAVAITVDDQGKGVAAADRERIFEPYVTTKETGTGLGLAIAKKIALEHDGTLEVAPEAAPTGGARFVITLPLRA